VTAAFLPPIAAIAPAQAPLDAPAAVAAIGKVPSSFATFVTDGLAEADRNIQSSQRDLQQLAAGEAPSLTQVMVRLEESRLAMQLVLQVRNRLLESYQEVMRMHV
jgi:flagellar hook-basal body complex protein FliE